MLLKNKIHISYEKNPFSTSIFNNNNNNLSENNFNEIFEKKENTILYG